MNVPGCKRGADGAFCNKAASYNSKYPYSLIPRPNNPEKQYLPTIGILCRDVFIQCNFQPGRKTKKQKEVIQGRPQLPCTAPRRGRAGDQHLHAISRWSRTSVIWIGLTAIHSSILLKTALCWTILSELGETASHDGTKKTI